MLDRICAVIVSIAGMLIQVCGCVAAGIGACALLNMLTPLAVCLASVIAAVGWFVLMPLALWKLLPRQYLLPDASSSAHPQPATDGSTAD